MKILHVTPAYEPAWHLGGVVRSVSQLCRGLAALGHEVTVFTTDSGKDLRIEVPVNRPVEVGGVRVHYFKADFTPRFGYSRALRQACLENVKSYDIVHLTSLWWYPGLAAGAAARRHRIPYVISPTGGLTIYSLAQKAWKKWLYLRIVEQSNLKKAAALRFTSAWEREQTAPLGFPFASFIIPNPVSVEDIGAPPLREQGRKEYQLPSRARTVAFLGRLHPVKGLDFLLKGFAEIKEQIPDLLLILAGPDDVHGGHLRQLTTQLGLTDRVIFTGYVPPEKKNSFFAAVDLFSLISQHENFGNAAVEAMLAGVPVLVSEHVGICREVAADGAGVVVPLTVEALAKALKEMLSDPEGLRAMGSRAAESARRRYDIRVVAEMMATAYEDILTGRRSLELAWSEG